MFRLLIIAALFLIPLSPSVKAQETEKTPAEKPQIFTISAFPPAKSNQDPEAVKLLNEAILLVVDRKPEEAVKLFTKAIKIDPKFADAYNRRGAAYSDALKQDLAIADFTKAIQLNPKFEIAYLNRGFVFMTFKKDYRSAIADFNKMIELSPESWMGLTFRATAYEKMGKKDLAASDRQKVKELMEKERQKSGSEKSRPKK